MFGRFELKCLQKPNVSLGVARVAAQRFVDEMLHVFFVYIAC